MSSMETISRRRLLIKICGITREEDAEACVQNGVDLLGVNLYPLSKRFINFEKAKRWLGKYENRMERVAVMVRPDFDEVRWIFDSGFIDCVQLHGDESPEFVAQLLLQNIPVIYAFRLGNPQQSKQQIEEIFEMTCRAFITDKFDDKSFGGTGDLIDMDLLKEFAARHNRRGLILAGGLTCHNVISRLDVGEFIGVDVAGGVESSPGIKSSESIGKFTAIVHGYKGYSQTP